MKENSLEYIELSRANISQEVINEFSSGNDNIDLFFTESSIDWTVKGIAVTYILVSKEDTLKEQITKIFAFATISCSGLLYTNADNKNVIMSCTEIKYFAIKKSFRGMTNDGLPSGERYSEIFFKMFLQELYYLSTSVIGFSMIYLQANEQGSHLYKRCNFEELSSFICPETDQKIDIEPCTPMGLMLSDENISSMYM